MKSPTIFIGPGGSSARIAECLARLLQRQPTCMICRVDESKTCFWCAQSETLIEAAIRLQNQVVVHINATTAGGVGAGQVLLSRTIKDWNTSGSEFKVQGLINRPATQRGSTRWWESEINHECPNPVRVDLALAACIETVSSLLMVTALITFAGTTLWAQEVSLFLIVAALITFAGTTLWAHPLFGTGIVICASFMTCSTVLERKSLFEPIPAPLNTLKRLNMCFYLDHSQSIEYFAHRSESLTSPTNITLQLVERMIPKRERKMFSKDKTPEKPVRFQAEIAPSFAEEMERLQYLGGLTSKKALMNEAFALLEWAVEQTIKGYAIASVDENDEVSERLGMPFLRQVARNSKSTTKEAVVTTKTASAS